MKEIFACKRCGFCCQGETTVSLGIEDQERMLGFLGISREEAIDKYWRISGDEVQMKTVAGHCIFFDNGCTVHPARPWRCREWPLVQAIIVDRLNFETISSSCPGLDPNGYAEACRRISNGLIDQGAENDRKQHEI